MEKTNQSNYWMLFSAILVVFLIFREGCHKIESNQLVADLVSYKDTARFEKLKNGALVSTNASSKIATQNQLKTIVENLNDTLAQMVKKYKLLGSITYLTNNYYAGGDTIKTKDSIPCTFEPFKIRRTNPSYTFVGTIAPKYFSIDSIYVPNNISIVAGRKKTGFMRYEYSIDVNNSNPLMVTTNIKDYRYTPEKKWFEKPWFYFVAGVAVKSGFDMGVNQLYKNH